MEKKMTDGSPMWVILKVSLPILVGQILQQFYNLADTMIVGQILGGKALAAVGTTYGLDYIVRYFCIGACFGISVPLAQSYGANDSHRLRCFFMNGIYFVSFLAVVITGGTVLFARQALVLLHTPGDIFEDAYLYMVILFLGLPFTILYNFCYGVLMAFGDSKMPSIFMAVSTVVNIGLDLLFVAGFHWGVEGAAIATVLSQVMAGVCCLIYIIKKYKILYPKKDEKKLQKQYIFDILRMSMPMGLQYSITAFGAVIMQNSVNLLGADAVASFSTGTKIKGFLLCPLNAFGTALSSYVGQNYGARKARRIRQGVRATMIMGVIYTVGVIIFVYFVKGPIVSLFVKANEPVMYAMTQRFIAYVSVFQLELVALFVCRYSVQGMGYGQYAIYSGLAEMFGRSLVAIFFVNAYGFAAVCWSEGVTFLLGILVIVPVYFMLMRRMEREFEDKGKSVEA